MGPSQVPQRGVLPRFADTGGSRVVCVKAEDTRGPNSMRVVTLCTYCGPNSIRAVTPRASSFDKCAVPENAQWDPGLPESVLGGYDLGLRRGM